MGLREKFPIEGLCVSPATGRLIGTLYDEIDRLRAELDAAQLRSIEARNPGINVEEVRLLRQREIDGWNVHGR